MRKRPSTASLLAGIRASDVLALSRAITLVESVLETDLAQADELIRQCLPLAGRSTRLGISGVPGVGKSTFIDALGMQFIEQGRRVAVLAIDPSSQQSKGSILGDKTRMARLSRHPSAYIRPSPAGRSLGGVARKTRESMLLCEAAGFDLIIVETVGVGQSEVAVQAMVDCFVLLMLPNAGDELQGIKKGILELVDIMLINKADGELLPAAQQARKMYAQLLHLFSPATPDWQPPVLLTSALKEEGLEEVLQCIAQFETHSKASGHWQKRRQQQQLYWMESTIRELLEQSFFEHPQVKQAWPACKAAVLAGELSPVQAARKLVHSWMRDRSAGSAPATDDS
ncbi:MAG: methylmalonyl Co-A mutase-associated GTPase MeaB [Bacteroidetes bacterium]|nr:MAG: methylmalonyl Co-A mutase-associated GTPase MeaB [Bacteroidota bacterium]